MNQPINQQLQANQQQPNSNQQFPQNPNQQGQNQYNQPQQQYYNPIQNNQNQNQQNMNQIVNDSLTQEQMNQQQNLQQKQQEQQQLQQMYNQNQTNGQETPETQIQGNARNFFQNLTNKQIKEKINQKQTYAQILQQQIELKKKKEQDEFLQDQQITQKMLQDQVTKKAYLTTGPQRDAYGNINNTRKNPYNPNHQSLDWFSHSVDQHNMPISSPSHHHNKSFQQLPTGNPQNMMNNSNFNHQQSQPQIPINNMYQQPMQMPQTSQMPQQQNQMQNSGVFNQGNMQQSFFNQPQEMQQSFVSQPREMQNSQIHTTQMMNDFFRQEQELLKKKQAQDVQRQQLLQMEDRKRQLELDKLEEKRKQEYEQLKLLREQAEREQHKSRAQARQTNKRQFNRNLFESGQQVLKLDKDQKPIEWTHKLGNIKKSRKDQWDFNNNQIHEEKDKSKIKKPQLQQIQNEKLEKLKEMEDQILMEQRIIKELPIEITRNVRDTVNKELLKLRHEMNLSNNNIGEQLMNLKGQLMRAQDRKGLINEELRHLHDEIKQTQVVDEIRQREIYDAFMKNQPINIYHNKEKLVNPDFIQKAKKVPGDLDYLLNQENFKKNSLNVDRYNQDVNNILNNDSIYQVNPISASNIIQPKDYKMVINDVPNYNQTALNKLDAEMAIENDLAYQRDGGNDVNVKRVLDDNSRRLDKLTEIDITNVNSEKGDVAFQDLVQNAQERSDYIQQRPLNNDEQKIQKLDQYVSFHDNLNHKDILNDNK